MDKVTIPNVLTLEETSTYLRLPIEKDLKQIPEAIENLEMACKLFQ